MDFSDWVIVFDLDDTLISEIEYQKSGFSAVESHLKNLYNIPVDGVIQKAFDDGVDDVLAWTCNEFGLSLDIKESLLWIYRLHRPCISLVDDMQDLLSFLEQGGAQLAILSDGRSVTQRLKINSVGLQALPLFISEDFGGFKPNPLRFLAVEDTWPQRKYAYIADNFLKDFVVPRQRGWLTVGALWVHSRVHDSSVVNDFNNCSLYQPHCWLDSPCDVSKFIKSSSM